MENNKQHCDFQPLWNHRKYAWQEKAAATVPDDDTILRLADRARRSEWTEESVVVPLNTRRRNRWIPYVAAASIVAGAVLIGVGRFRNVSNTGPQVQKADVDGHTMFFMCNNGCSVQDFIFAATDVIKNDI